MKTLVVYCHPNMKSFNHAILETVTAELSAKGYPNRVTDLYASSWNPVLSQDECASLLAGEENSEVTKNQEDVEWANFLVFIFPIWWFERPAMLKGWFDRVFTEGFAYNMTEKGMEGLLTGKKALIITTSGGDKNAMEASGTMKALEITFSKGSLGSTGITEVHHMNCAAVPMVSDETRKQYLEEIALLIRNY